MGQPYDLAIVGMGSAGMVAAEFASTLGIRVVAIERDRVGGDCLWTGCVPSKALLASAKAAHTIRHAAKYGLESRDPEIDTGKVLARVRAIQEQLAATDDNAERFVEAGIEVVFGAARLTGSNTVEVEGHGVVEAKNVLLCTGSRPAVPPIPGLDEAGFLTSETLWDQERLPASLVIIGGGPIACELAQACRRLGVQTRVLELAPSFLPRDEPALVEVLVEVLRAEGVELNAGVMADRVSRDGAMKVVHAGDRSWRAEEILVAAGRTPNVAGLGLEEHGIEVSPRGVVTDDAYRTAVKSVYAVGDVAGRWLFTHSAGFEAARAIRNMLFPGKQAKAFGVPWCTFTDPELAHVGLTGAEAVAQFGESNVQVWRQDLSHSDRARAESADRGAVIVVTAKGKVVGGHALAPAAGELIHELALAVHEGLKLTELAGMVHVYPTISIAIQQLAGEASYEGAQKYKFLVRP